MKRMKNLLSLVLALVMVMAMTLTAMATVVDDGLNKDEDTFSITISNENANHTYEAYQIFSTDFNELKEGETVSQVLSNIEWGTGVKQEELISELQTMSAYSGCNTAEDVAKVLQNFGNDSDELDAFAAVVAKHLADEPTGKTSTQQTGDVYVIEGLKPGYYMVMDASRSLEGMKDEAYTKFIIEVVDNAEATVKSRIPSVEKEVQDNETDEWGTTADHAINEKFNFRLTAMLPADPNFDAYESYKLVFNDTMSDGITYEGIVSVKVYVGAATVGTDIPAYDEENPDGYVLNQEDSTLTLTIKDLVKWLSEGEKLSNGIKIEVVYTAHLNEGAIVAKQTESAESVKNKNTVNLQYSNNPNAEGEGELGKTPDKEVFVFTYDVPSKKVDGTNAGAEVEPEELPGLVGAEFRLYKYDESAKDHIGEEVLLTEGSDGIYRPVTEGTTEGEAIVVSEEEGKEGEFNFAGLDEGHYMLKETKTPAGYNTCDPVEITITETKTADTQVHESFERTTGDINYIQNKKGVTLPETGGIGTTIFTVSGIILVIIAGVLLVTKKRMSKEE